MMPRPSLPKAEEVAGFARTLRAEDSSLIREAMVRISCEEGAPDG